ncbi:MAG: tRNA pseudouridine(55) synthase TruB [Negativicutes bacterium]|nr:tRNA pseudouridine(55) synthase TruB [Negativicutes bacterium]
MLTNGIINVLKPPGMTSHDVVSFIRRRFSLKRVGHAGTLDPAAAGVLPVFLGHATRLIEYQTEADKSYRAEITLGYATDSGDDTGSIIRQSAFAMPDIATITQTLNSFLGVINQIPPMHSAIKVEGKKLYELARAGLTIERRPRMVVIREIKIAAVDEQRILFDVTCSKGTYIRTLCSDIGDKLGIPAVMSFLVRTRVGPFRLSQSLSLEEISYLGENALLPADLAVSHLPTLTFSDADCLALAQGKTVPLTDYLPAEPNIPVRIYNPAGCLIGLCVIKNHYAQPTKIFYRG